MTNSDEHQPPEDELRLTSIRDVAVEIDVRARMKNSGFTASYKEGSLLILLTKATGFGVVKRHRSLSINYAADPDGIVGKWTTIGYSSFTTWEVFRLPPATPAPVVCDVALQYVAYWRSTRTDPPPGGIR